MIEFDKGALILIRAERKAQIEKWGDQSGHSNLYWLGILGEEFGEVCELMIPGAIAFTAVDGKALMIELVQTAAVACQWLEILEGINTEAALDRIRSAYTWAIIKNAFVSPFGWLSSVGCRFGVLSKQLIEREGDLEIAARL